MRALETFTRNVPLKGLMQQREMLVSIMHMALFLHHLLPGPHNTILWSIQVSGLGGKSMTMISQMQFSSPTAAEQFQQSPPLSKVNLSGAKIRNYPTLPPLGMSRECPSCPLQQMPNSWLETHPPFCTGFIFAPGEEKQPRKRNSPQKTAFI